MTLDVPFFSLAAFTHPYNFHAGKPSSRATSAILFVPARASFTAVSLNSLSNPARDEALGFCFFVMISPSDILCLGANQH